MEQVYLSRRNLMTLLSKLDRKSDGDETLCTIIKNDSCHPKYKQTMDAIAVTAVEDSDYYCDRDPGVVHHKDTPSSKTVKKTSITTILNKKVK